MKNLTVNSDSPDVAQKVRPCMSKLVVSSSFVSKALLR